VVFTDAKEEKGDDVVHRAEEESESGAKSISYQDRQTDRAHADHRQESLLKKSASYNPAVCFTDLGKLNLPMVDQF
jgi:hypothetical protein